MLTALQKLWKSSVFFQSYDRKCTASFFRFTVYLANLQKIYNLANLHTAIQHVFNVNYFCTMPLVFLFIILPTFFFVILPTMAPSSFSTRMCIIKYLEMTLYQRVFQAERQCRYAGLWWYSKHIAHQTSNITSTHNVNNRFCLLYTSDAADE